VTDASPRTYLHNRTREKMARGELVIGLSLRLVRTPEIGRMLETTGFDFGFIDQEHSAYSLDTTSHMAVAMQDVGITPFVRVAGHEPWQCGLALDGGALGIFFPGVTSGEQAAHLAALCRFPPVGVRSLGSTPQLAFRDLPLAEATAIANREVVTVMMLEGPEAIERAEEIAAVPGADVLLVGANDLGMALEIPGQPEHPRLVAAFERVVDACRRHGKVTALGGVYEESALRRYVRMGVRLVLSGNDLGMMMAGMAQRAALLRGVLDG